MLVILKKTRVLFVVSCCLLLVTLWGLNGCGSTSIEELRSDSVGNIPGQFVVRLSNSFRENLNSLMSSLSKVFPGANLTSRFGEDDTSFGLASEDCY